MKAEIIAFPKQQPFSQKDAAVPVSDEAESKAETADPESDEFLAGLISLY